VDTFGTEMPKFARDEITGKIEQLPSDKKILFFISMKAPVTAAEKAIAQAIEQMTVGEIQSTGLKDPKQLASLFKTLSKEDAAKLFNKLVQTPGGKKAIETIQRVVLDQRAGTSKWKILASLTGAAAGLFGLAHTLNFLGFLGEETIQTRGLGVFTLVSNKQWKDAAKALQEYKQTVDLVSAGIDNLIKIPILNIFLTSWWPNYKASAYKQIEDYDKLIKKNLAEQETGEIAIETTPTGATVFIDNIQHKYPTNTVVSKLVPKKYTVRLILKGYKEHEEEVEVKEGQQTRIVHEFEPIPEKPALGAGRLEWETVDKKTGAAVISNFYINDRLEKASTTALALDLKPDAYDVRWTAAGYKEVEDTIAIEEGKTLSLKVEMEKIEAPEEEFPGVTCETLGYHTEKPEDGREYEQIQVRGLTCWALKEITKGKLEISSDPKASVWILGEKAAEETPTVLELEQGMYDITLKAKGYKPETVRVYINPKQTVVRAITLQPEETPVEERKVWRVDIHSVPLGAKILVNYAWTEKYTPDYVLLDPGQYIITLTKSGYEPWETPLTLEEIESE